MKRIIALLLCVCLTASLCVIPVCAANWYTQIGNVRFAGGTYLDTIDLSALVRDASTVTTRPLRLYRVYDKGTAYESCDRIANFIFDETQTGMAILDDYPGAQARIEPGDYRLEAVDGCLFDNMKQYDFSAADYYRNAFGSNGLRPNRVGLPAFSDYTVTESEGETVYAIQMTLSPDLAAFYDTYDPDAQIRILCKYSYAVDDVFAVIYAHASAYDPTTGVLTVEPLHGEGEAGATLFSFCGNEDHAGFVFEFEYDVGLFRCGKVPSMLSFQQLTWRSINSLPRHIFTNDTVAGRLYNRLSGATWSEKHIKKALASTALLCLIVPIWVRHGIELVRAVRAFENNTADEQLQQILQGLREIYF